MHAGESQPNPYASPAGVLEPPGLWQRFTTWLGLRSVDRLDRIRRGAFFVCYGVYYRLPPDGSCEVYAYLPWTNLAESRASENIVEARRTLTGLLDKQPELRPLVAGRDLVVIQVFTYEDFDAEMRRDTLPAADWPWTAAGDEESADDATS